MRVAIKHKIYGDISYEENIFLKCNLFINGVLLQRIKKNLFSYHNNNQKFDVTIKGVNVRGVKIIINNEEIEMVQKPNKSDYLLASTCLIIMLLIGFSGTSNATIPYIRPIVYSLLSSFSVYLAFFYTTLKITFWEKLIIYLGFSFATLAISEGICFLIGILIVFIISA